MSKFSVPDIIKLGDISVPLSANYNYDGEVLGKRLATTSPLTIAIVTDALRWHYEGFPPTSLEDAVGSITITSVGNNGDKIEVFVNDVELGLISLGSYIKQPTDTDVNTLAENIALALGGTSLGCADYLAAENGDSILTENSENLIIE